MSLCWKSRGCKTPGLASLLTFLFLLLVLPVRAEPHKHPRVILVECDGLIFDDLNASVTPHLRELAEIGAIGMMQCATTDFAGVGAEAAEEHRADPKSPSGIIDDPVRLVQRALESETERVVVLFGDLTRADTARSRLTSQQVREFHLSALRRLNLFFYLLTEKLKAEEWAPDVILAATRPPSDTRLPTGAWGRLTPILAFGPHFPPGLLTSGTTRTVGVVARSDLAPTIYSLLDKPTPAKETGRPIASKPSFSEGAERVAAVARIDYIAFLNGQGQLRIIMPLGTVCSLLVLLGLIARKRGGVTWGRRFVPALIFCLNLPAALLLAPLLIPPTLLEYGLRILAWQIGLTLVCYLLAYPPLPRPLSPIGDTPLSPDPFSPTEGEKRDSSLLPPPSSLRGARAALLAALLTIALVVGDILCGQPLMKDSLLSCGMLYGVRFYGIGNEYLGVLLGFVFTVSFALLDAANLPPEDRRRWRLVPFWLGLTGLLGWPGLGANAGSLITMGAGIAVGIEVLRGRRPAWWQAALGMAGGLLTAFIFALLDAKLHPGGSVSHLGGALQSASGGRGLGYLLEIATRKIGLNLSLLFTVWFLMAVLIVVGILLLARILMGDALRNALSHRPWTARSLPVTLAVGVAALIFKDTGVVTVTFLLGATCLILFAFAFVEPEKTTNA